MDNIENIMNATLSQLKGIIDSDSVIGTPITSGDGVTIIPISKLTFGFVTGGGEYSETAPKTKLTFPYAGASGGGVTIKPLGFLVVGKDKSFITVDSNYEESKWVNLAKGILDKCKKGE